MSFDLAGSLRRLKPSRRTRPLARRSDQALLFADDEGPNGLPLLLDTTVYIDVLRSRAPQAVKSLLRSRLVNHSAVAVGELTHLFGRLGPPHADTEVALAEVKGTVDDIPAHRLSAPSVQAIAEAGIVTGLMARLRGLPSSDRQPFMNDATLFLQALENGWILLSGNIADMDLIEQLVPAGRVLLYRQV